MSLNQSRAEKSDGHLRRPGRSGSSAHHRGFSGGGKGGGGGGSAPPPVSSSNPPALSAGRSFTKSGNGQGGQSRVTSSANSSFAVSNGTHVPVSSHGSSEYSAPSGAKTVEASTQRNSRALPRASSSQTSQSATASSDSTVPSTPTKGDASKAFTLQFGSISPGIMNGVPIPARTSSAPPNLDEQKRMQARHDSFRAVPTMPISSAIKQQQQQQQTRKDVGSVSQSNNVLSHPPVPTKRDVHVSIPSVPTVTPPKSTVLPLGGIPMHMPFQQPQIPMHFGGPSPQMQSQGIGANSLQMTMALPVGNGPQVPQQMFVPNIQPHQLQQQAMMHQGQSLGFAPQMGHQLPPQLSNLGMGIPPQFSQQQPGKFGAPRKTKVKITHPDTHEELRLDKRTDSNMDGGAPGQRSLPNVTPQLQPIPSFNPAHQINYYPPLQTSSYSPSPIFFPPPNSLPSTTTQMNAGPQAPRYTYPVVQSGQAISFMKPSVHNPMLTSKPGPPPSSHGVSVAANLEPLPVSAPSAPVQVTIKPAVCSLVEKSGKTSVPSSILSSNAEVPKLSNSEGDSTASHQKMDGDIVSESSIHKTVELLDNASFQIADECSTAGSSVISAQILEPRTFSAVPADPAGDSGSVQSETDGSRKKAVQELESLEYQRKTGKKDGGHFQQQNQVDASEGAGVSNISSKTNMGSGASVETVEEISKVSEIMESLSGSDSFASTTGVPSPTVEHCSPAEFRTSKVIEAEAVPAVVGSSVTVPEKETSEDSSLGGYDSLYLATDSVSSQERGPFKGSAVWGPKAERAMPEISGSASCIDECELAEAAEKQDNLAEMEHAETGVSTDLPRDSNNHKPCLDSTASEFSEVIKPIDLVRQVDVGSEYSKKESVHESYYGKKEQPITKKDSVNCRSEVDGVAEKLNALSTSTSDFKDAQLIPSSPHSFSDPTKDKPSSHDVTNRCVLIDSLNVGLSGPGISPTESASVLTSVSSETKQNIECKATELSNGVAVSVAISGPKDKPNLEPVRARSNAVRKKKKKEILLKADAAGTSDLYNAYKAPEEKHESTTTSESIDSTLTAAAVCVRADDLNMDVVAGEEDRQGKAEIDDWEDAADITTPKLRSPENNEQVNGNDATSKKRFSRDFLLTFAEECTDLPVDFKVDPDAADALKSVLIRIPHIFDHEAYPSPGRIKDRSPGASRGDYHMAGLADDDKWMKAASSFGPGRDIRLDMGHGAANISFRPGQGVNHGVLRNPRAQSPNHFAGGILSGPVQTLSSQGGIPRSNVDADRWQRASGIQRGLIPSPHAPSQVMHKATNKYEIGKVSDKEEAKQRQLKAILNKLTPQNFEKLFLQVKEVDIDNTVTLSGVISQIFDKALMEPTFCEMYANFCVHLANELPDFNEENEKITFKRLLLNKCQEEFERGEREQAEAERAEEEGEITQTEEEREQKRIQARRRMLGNIRLIGELYKKRMLTERIMHECIKKLLGQYQNPDEEDIEALCKLMSTIGEMIDHSKAKEHMDAYFDRMSKLSTNQKLSSRVRFMLRDAIDLRKNKWQQRRKVEGPKKIDEVHRDAAQERQAQTSRLARGPVIGSTPRRGPTVDYGPRGSSSPSSMQMGGTRGLSAPVRGYATQDVRMEERRQFESRVLSVPLPQRPTDDNSITLGPQGGLARGMSTRGQAFVSNAPSGGIPPSTGDSRRLASGSNGYSSVAREESMQRHTQDKFSGASYDQRSPEDCKASYRNRDIQGADRGVDRSSATTSPGRFNGPSSGILPPSEAKPLSEERLREKSISAIREFYSAKDEKEVALCIKELNSPNFYPSMVSLWVTDSFERKDMERDLLARLFVNLCKSNDSLLGETELLQGFQSVLSLLEDAVNDAPKAAEFLGHMFAKVTLGNVVSLRKLAKLVQEGGEEPGSLVETGLASEVLGSILEYIRTEKGDSVLSEFRTSSNLQLEDFRPPHPIKSNKLDAFI